MRYLEKKIQIFFLVFYRDFTFMGSNESNETNFAAIWNSLGALFCQKLSKNFQRRNFSLFQRNFVQTRKDNSENLSSSYESSKIWIREVFPTIFAFVSALSQNWHNIIFRLKHASRIKNAHIQKLVHLKFRNCSCLNVL